MKIKQIHLVLVGMVVVGVLFGVSLTQLPAQVGNQGKPTTVAVCELVKILPEFKLSKDLAEKFQKRMEEYSAEKKKRMEAANTSRKAIDGLKTGSPAHTAELKKLRRQLIELEVWGKMEEQSMQADHLRQMEMVVSKVKEGIAAVAKQRGIDIVIQKNAPIEANRSQQEWMANVVMDKVLYNSPQQDITEAVLQHLNENYRIGG